MPRKSESMKLEFKLAYNALKHRKHVEYMTAKNATEFLISEGFVEGVTMPKGESSTLYKWLQKIKNNKTELKPNFKNEEIDYIEKYNPLMTKVLRRIEYLEEVTWLMQKELQSVNRGVMATQREMNK